MVSARDVRLLPYLVVVTISLANSSAARAMVTIANSALASTPHSNQPVTAPAAPRIRPDMFTRLKARNSVYINCVIETNGHYLP